MWPGPAVSFLVGGGSSGAVVVSGRACVRVRVCLILLLISLLCGTEGLSVNTDSGPARPSILKQGNFPVRT